MHSAKPSWAERMLHAALAIPITYHAMWNLSAAGARWWLHDSGLPTGLRFVVGIAELAAVVAIALGPLRRVAALTLSLLLLGAIPQHWRLGYSFKGGGWEPVLAYAMVALSIAMRSSPATSLQKGTTP